MRLSAFIVLIVLLSYDWTKSANSQNKLNCIHANTPK